MITPVLSPGGPSVDGAVSVQPTSIEFGAVTPGTTGGQLAYVNNCPAATAVTVSVTGSSVFSVARFVHPAPAPTERVVVEDRENDGSAALSTRAGSILTIYMAATMPVGGAGLDASGELVVTADGQPIVQLPLHAIVAQVSLRLDPGSVSVRQGESVPILMIATSVAGPDTDVSVSFLGGEGPPSAGTITLQSTGTQLPAGQARSFPGTLSVSTDSAVGSYSGWIIAEAFGGLQGANDARGHFLGVPLTIAVTPGKPAVAAPPARIPVIEGRSVTVPVDMWLGSDNGRVTVALTGESLPAGITLTPSPQWITAIDNPDFHPNTPQTNVNAQGMVRSPIATDRGRFDMVAPPGLSNFSAHCCKIAQPWQGLWPPVMTPSSVLGVRCFDAQQVAAAPMGDGVLAGSGWS